MDAARFKRFYERSAPALSAYLRFSCRGGAMADDVLQETYLRLLRAAPPALDEAALKRYLYRTAQSVLVDHARRAERDRRLLRAAAVSDLAQVSSCGACDAAAYELPRYLERALGALKPREQRLLWLAYVEGFSHREIAEVIGVREKSVRVLLKRARERIAAILADQGNDPGEA